MRDHHEQKHDTPNESTQYRSARDKLLEEERKLVEQTKAVAALPRELPPCGELKEDYTFPWATADIQVYIDPAISGASTFRLGCET